MASEGWLPPSMLSSGDLVTFLHKEGTERHGIVKYTIEGGCVIRRTDEYGVEMALALEEIHDGEYTVKEDQ